MRKAALAIGFMWVLAGWGSMAAVAHTAAPLAAGMFSCHPPTRASAMAEPTSPADRRSRYSTICDGAGPNHIAICRVMVSASTAYSKG